MDLCYKSLALCILCNSSCLIIILEASVSTYIYIRPESICAYYRYENISVAPMSILLLAINEIQLGHIYMYNFLYVRDRVNETMQWIIYKLECILLQYISICKSDVIIYIHFYLFTYIL